MSERFAKPGQIYVCAACGKTARGDYGTDGSPGWDESCMLNAVLCHAEKRINPADGMLVFWPIDGDNEE